jgi:hypothetical protein
MAYNATPAKIIQIIFIAIVSEIMSYCLDRDIKMAAIDTAPAPIVISNKHIAIKAV